MAECQWCFQEMMVSCSCHENNVVEFPNGEVLPSVPYHNSYGESSPCHDCNAPEGGFHHPGCDAERCPICQGQLISCGCLDEPEEDDEE